MGFGESWIRSGSAPPVAVVTTCSSCRGIGDMVIANVVVSPARTTTLSTVRGANPMRAVTYTVYVPAGRFTSRYAPSASDFADAAPPPPSRDAFTVAPESGSPETRSVTRPLIVPVCAIAGNVVKMTVIAAHQAPRNDRVFNSERLRKTDVVGMHSLQGGNSRAFAGRRGTTIIWHDARITSAFCHGHRRDAGGIHLAQARSCRARGGFMVPSIGREVVILGPRT